MQMHALVVRIGMEGWRPSVANKESNTDLPQKASLLSPRSPTFPKASESSWVRYGNELVNTAVEKYSIKGMIVNP